MIDAQSATSTRPYLIRALYEWCTDNGLTPYVAVLVDDSVQVPREYVKDGEIVLNVSFDATSSLKLGNDFIAFSARFAGKAREIMVPVERVIAIYARENGQGMAFPRPESSIAAVPALADEGGSADKTSVRSEVDVKLVGTSPGEGVGQQNDPKPDGPRPAGKKRPKLTRVK